MLEILTISAQEYAEMEGRKLSDYFALGVHMISLIPVRSCWKFVDKFTEQAPNNAEVVVGYNSQMVFVPNTKTRNGMEENDFILMSAQGTALMPREKEGELAEKAQTPQ